GNVKTSPVLNDNAQKTALMVTGSTESINRTTFTRDALHDMYKEVKNGEDPANSFLLFNPQLNEVMKNGIAVYRSDIALALPTIMNNAGRNEYAFVPAESGTFPYKREILLSPYLTSIGIGSIAPAFHVF